MPVQADLLVCYKPLAFIFWESEELCPSGIVDFMNKGNWGQCICCDDYPLVATPAPTMGGTAPDGYELQGVYNMVECD